jgi:hypothetical protein
MRNTAITMFFLVAVILLPAISFSQNTGAEDDTVSMGILLRKELSGNVMLHTLGYGAGFRKGWNKTYYKRYFLEAEIMEMRSPNQARIYFPYADNTRGYFYGKLNALDIIRIGAGRSTLLNRKPYWGGIDVRHFFSGGLSLGLAVPVYLNIAYFTKVDYNYYYTIQVEKYDPEKHFIYMGTNPDCNCAIYSKGPMLKGFTELTPHPGLYLKTGFNFDFSKINDRIRAVEAGIVAEGYLNSIQMMAFDDPRRFFITGYFNFQFGKNYD